jgi:hypothetical protein
MYAGKGLGETGRIVGVGDDDFYTLLTRGNNPVSSRIPARMRVRRCVRLEDLGLLRLVLTWATSFFALSPSTSRVTARTLYFGFLSSWRTTPPPWTPVAPKTRTVDMMGSWWLGGKGKLE